MKFKLKNLYFSVIFALAHANCDSTELHHTVSGRKELTNDS